MHLHTCGIALLHCVHLHSVLHYCTGALCGFAQCVALLHRCRQAGRQCGDFLTSLLVIRLIRSWRTMSSQPGTMSQPPAISLHSWQGEKCQKNLHPPLTLLKSAKKICTHPEIHSKVPKNISSHHLHGVQFNGAQKALAQSLTRLSRNQPGYQILAFLLDLNILCKYLHCETQRFSEALRRLALQV